MQEMSGNLTHGTNSINTQLPKLEEVQVTKSVKFGGEIFVVRAWKTKDERNFLVKKAAMSKKDSEDEEKIKSLLINDLVKPCLIQGDIAKLSMNQIKRLMIILKCISSGELVEGLVFKCQECNHANNVDIEVSEDTIKYKEFDNSIKEINSKISIKFKPMPYTFVKSDMNEIDIFFHTIDTIIIDGVHYTSFNKTNLEEFIDSLDLKSTKKMIQLLQTCNDDIDIKTNIKCQKCGNDIEVDLEDIPNFFIP